jgi:hypothetical protein
VLQENRGKQEKVALLYQAENQFKRELLRKIKEKK